MRKSHSDEQMSAESYIRDALNHEYGLSLKPRKLDLGGGVCVELDGFDEENRVLCEIYARVGRLKGAQPNKLAADILKMELIERKLTMNFRKMIAFCDAEAARSSRSKSWLSYVASELGVDVEVMNIPEDVRVQILIAQERQKMVNA